jgi:LuxR family transcriptional regulator, maltose regulon positive regulatory protein
MTSCPPEVGRVKRETGGEGEAGSAGATKVDPVVTDLAPVVSHLDSVGERFEIPRQQQGLLPRSRLLKHLDLGVEVPLTLVSAPAGTGKTVLVSTWARRAQAKGPVAWVTLEAWDASRTRFWWSFTQGLGRCGVVVDLPSAQSDVDELDGSMVDAVVASLLERAESGRAAPVVMVLDCEAEISAAVAEDLDALLRRSDGLLRLVVVTRVDPVLPLHRYRLAGSVVEVRMADLAFTLDEARELMTRAGVDLSDAALQTIVDRTQGWGAGLRFAAVSLTRQQDTERAALDFSGGIGDVAEYFIAEVLDVQSAGGRQLLLETSIVDVLRPGLSEAVAGPQAQRALALLIRGNAFLSELDDSPNCYRYQPLFRDLLRAQLAYESPARVPDLHRAAAAWMADHGLVEEAVRHSVAAGDWEGATRYLIDDLAIGRLLLPGPDALSGVLARMPDGTEGAAASLVRAALAMAVFDVEVCEAHLVRADEQLNGARTPRWSAAALALQTVRLAHDAAVGNVERGLGAAAAAARLMQLQVSERLDEHPELSVLIASGKGATWLAKGRLDDAVEAFSAAAHVAERPGCEPLLINCLGHLAVLAAMRGQLRKAVDLAARVAAVQQEAGIEAVECPSAVVALAWVNTELYDLPAARRHVQRAAESLSVAHDPTLRVLLALVDSRVRRARGDVDGALARIMAARSDIPVPPQWLQEVLCIEEAELNVANGQPVRAAQMIRAMSQQGSPESALVLARARRGVGGTSEFLSTAYWSNAASLTTRVGGWLYEAVRQLDGGEELQAVRALQRSLRLAAPERLRRPFREASPQVRQLLRGDRQLTAEHSWLGAATLDDAHPYSQPPITASRPVVELHERDDKPGPSQMIEPLTEKEREVLGHLAAMLTTDEIAGAMFVSVNTVRTHVRNILRKLGASRRNEAVRRARELGVIVGWMPVEPTNGSRPA